MKMPPENTVFALNVSKINSIRLQPEEAFVLTRIDGHTTLAQVSQIVGFDIPRVWKLLARAVEAGVVTFKDSQPAAGPKVRSSEKPSGDTILKQLDDEDRDPTLSKIPRSQRIEILMRYQAMAEQTHYELMGVKPFAHVDEVRAAYFQLVKSIHPDRFFGKSLGPYKDKLDELFSRVQAAFNDLTDDSKKSIYDRRLKIKEEAASPLSPKVEKPTGFMTGKTIVERFALAKKYFDMGKNEEESGNGLQAANFYLMAAQFEPDNLLYVKALERMSPFLARKRAEELYEKGMEALELADEDKAIEFLEECLKLNPKKRECYRGLASIYLKFHKNLGRAKELGERATEMYKNDAGVRVTLGRIFMELGDLERAKAAFKSALKIDRDSEDAQSGIELLKQR